LAHRAFSLQISQKLGCKILPHFRSLKPALLEVLLCPATAMAPLFCLISAEADLLTGRKKTKTTTVNNLKIRHWLVRVAQNKQNH
jgi:IS1 family transposase